MTCTHGTARAAAAGQGKAVISAPSATVTWRHQQHGDHGYIFAMREAIEEQLIRVRGVQREIRVEDGADNDVGIAMVVGAITNDPSGN